MAITVLRSISGDNQHAGGNWQQEIVKEQMAATRKLMQLLALSRMVLVDHICGRVEDKWMKSMDIHCI